MCLLAKTFNIENTKNFNFSLNCLPTISFTWNFSYPFMANKEFMSNLTSEFKSKIFYDPGARWLSFLSDKQTRKDERTSDLHEIVWVGQHTLVNMVKEWSWDKKKQTLHEVTPCTYFIKRVGWGRGYKPPLSHPRLQNSEFKTLDLFILTYCMIK